jgi:hypothetical protein
LEVLVDGAAGRLFTFAELNERADRAAHRARMPIGISWRRR